MQRLACFLICVNASISYYHHSSTSAKPQTIPAKKMVPLVTYHTFQKDQLLMMDNPRSTTYILPHSVVYKNNDGYNIVSDDLCGIACGYFPNNTYACDAICYCEVCSDENLCEEARDKEIELIDQMCIAPPNSSHLEVVHPIINCRDFNKTALNGLCDRTCARKCYQEQICEVLPHLNNCSHLSNSFMMEYQTSNEKDDDKWVGYGIMLLLATYMMNGD